MKDPNRIYKRIIRIVCDRGHISQKDLSTVLDVSSAAVSRALGRLEAEGLVKRKKPSTEDKCSAQRRVESFCIGSGAFIVIVRILNNGEGFEYISMNFDGSDRRTEHIFFRAELSFDDNCKAAVNEVALRLKLLRTSGRRFALGIIDDESRCGFWKNIGADIITSGRGIALLLGEMRGGVGCYLEVISPDDVKISVLFDGKKVCTPSGKQGNDISSAVDLAAVMNIENVFVFAPDELEGYIEARLIDCFCEFKRPLHIVNCGAAYQENLLKGLLAERITDLLI